MLRLTPEMHLDQKIVDHWKLTPGDIMYDGDSVANDDLVDTLAQVIAKYYGFETQEEHLPTCANVGQA